MLIASRAPRIRVRSETTISVRSDRGVELGHYGSGDWIVIERASADAIRIADDSLPVRSITLSPRSASSSIALSILRDGDWQLGSKYPGHLCVTLDDEGRTDVINRVDIEQYLSSVVASEVWPTFEAEAYRTQAIISRSFVLYRMQRRSDAAFDVVATQADQVYRGLRSDTAGRKAAEAARDTRGIVCTWRDRGADRLFSTYYSSACGGESQSAAIFSPDDRMEPLAGGVRCDYCKIAPGETYRWGPVRLPLEEVLSRLVARDHELAALGRLGGVTAIERTPSGRLRSIRLTGRDGSTRQMLAERFRLALGSNLVRSTDCEIRVERGELVLENGRGFGHGLGLCQWGMEGQARLGRKAGEILRFYYPGCRLTRVY